MKDITKPLTIGYFNLLDGMEIEGVTVPFFDLMAGWPEGAPYILLTGIISDNRNTADSFDSVTTVDLLICTWFAGDFGSMNLADAISQEILNRVVPRPGHTNVEAEGFNIMGARLVFSRGLPPDHRQDKTVFEKRLTFEHLTEQL